MQVRRQVSQTKPTDQEQTLLDLASRLANNWCAVHIHLSRISAVKRNENIVFALQMFENSVRALNGRLLVLKNGDWVYLYPDIRMSQVGVAVSKLRRLFASDPLYFNEEKYEADFTTWYALERDRPEFLELAKSLAGETGEAARGEPPESGPPSLRVVTRASELLAMAQTIEAIERTNLASFLRRQAVCRISGEREVTWLFDEFYFSIVDLETSLNRSPILTGDAIFLQYVTKCLDKKLIDLLRPACQGNESANLSINLNVSSVLSPEFTDFDAAIEPAIKQTIALEFQFIDVFSDLGLFLYVRGLLRERGYEIFLDGLTEANLPFADASRLGVDFLKVRWSPAVANASGELRDAIKAAGPERVVLCRCDSGESLAFGQAVGVQMYQGRHVSELLRLRSDPGGKVIAAHR